MRLTSALVLWLATLLIVRPLQAQYQARPALSTSNMFNAALFQGLQWRNIGPFRGGRSVAVTGVVNNPLVYYMGSTGGGIWKTDDGGLSWANISDGFFNTGSVGAICVAPSDPNLLYAGMGEHTVRSTMTSHGDGLYRSTDGGRTWTHLGLIQSQHISRIIIHPQQPNIVFVAVQGALYGPSEERGVYKSTDGGQTWRRVLFLNSTTGACDLSIDPANPRILFAGMWDHQRSPWQLRSGGPGSGVFRSTDGGETWQKLTEGLPAEIGKVAVTISPADSRVVYANIEAETGGVFRSDDGGDTWRQVSADRATVGRAWYFMEIVADPVHPETVYVLNDPLLKSIDGGRTFEEIPTPHGDQHDLWINPQNPRNFILANDGGACITYNGGQSWSSQYNQPTGQFYRVVADHRFPYTLYGGQQDHSTVAIPSQTDGLGISGRDWYSVGGCESAFIAFDPEHPRQVYSGCYQGGMEAFDQLQGIRKDVSPYPEMGLGNAPRSLKYRFNWNAPIVVDPLDPPTLYHAANRVLRSRDGGRSWQEISPDLTRNQAERQGAGGIPFTNEAAGAETYNTISYLACSPLEAGVIWAGADDGLLHITRDSGAHWTNVTPRGLGEALINCIEVSPHQPGTAYIAATRYRWNDFRPLIFYTADYGRTWTRITTGIAGDHFTRVVREDPLQPGLLYAGTEGGLYISFSQGKKWHRWQLNLPVCPVTDLLIYHNDLIAATSGRGFWILDDLNALQQSLGELPADRSILFAPGNAIRFAGKTPEYAVSNLGQNPLPGLILDYYLPYCMDSLPLTLEIFDRQQRLIRSYSNQLPEPVAVYAGGPPPGLRLPSRKGINRFYWDLRREPLPGITGTYVPGNYQSGLAPPGEYTLRFTLPGEVLEQSFQVLPDPRIQATPEDYATQEETLTKLEHAVREIHRLVVRMREVNQQLAFLLEQMKKAGCADPVLQQGRLVRERLTKWEESVVQSNQQTKQDVINFPNRLNAELIDLIDRLDTPDPKLTDGTRLRAGDLLGQWSQQRSALQQILDEDLGRFSRMYKEQDLPAVVLPTTVD